MPTQKAQKRGVETRQQLPPEQRGALLRTLKARFEKHMTRHQGLQWTAVQARLEAILKDFTHSMRWNGRVANLTSLVTTRRQASTSSTTVQRKAPKAAAVCVTTGKRWRQERNTSRRTARRRWRPPWGLRSSRKRSIESCRRWAISIRRRRVGGRHLLISEHAAALFSAIAVTTTSSRITT